jgi:predicted Zn-dependent protease
MLAIVCHELAHSALNHSFKTFKKFDDPNITAAFDARDTYMTAHYDEARGVYRHERAAYAAAVQRFSAGTGELSVFDRREESEADVVGGMLCGQMGMPVKTYANLLIGFLRKVDAAVGGSGGAEVKPGDMTDGEELQVSKDSAQAFTFPLDDHPTNDERAAQLQRLADTIGKRYAQAGYAEEWARNWAANGMGLMLGETEGPLVKSAVSSEGRKIVIPPRRNFSPR